MGASFATVDDYAARYGTPDDESRVEALLEDAAAMLAAAFRRHFGRAYEEGYSDDFDASATAVCCAVVSRAVNVPSGMVGVTQFTQTGGPYSASFSSANPTGDLYLSKSDLERLGLVGTRVWSIQPAIDAGDGDE